MGYRLRFIAPASVEGSFHLIRGETTVGRSETAAIRVDDPRVSRRHARLFLDEGSLIVEDLGSPNGTVVNGLRVARQELVAGDVLVLGKHKLRVETDAPSQAAVPTSPSGLIKPVSGSLPPSLEGVGMDAFYRALGLGDDTIIEASPRASAGLLAKTRHFAVLHEVSHVLRAAHTPRGMLARLLDMVLEVSSGDRGFVVLAPKVLERAGTEEDDTLPPEDGSEVSVEVVRTRGSGEHAEPPQLSSTVARHVLSERCAVLSHDSIDDTRFAESESLFLSQTRALMAVPILLREEVLGALVVESERMDAFAEPDLDLLTVISSTVGQTLENLRLAEKREATIRQLREAQSSLLATREQLVRSEQLAAIGRLASGLAHEVKNHLSPFMLADMIARKYPDDEEIQSSVEMMLEARQHIVDLVSEVKGFARGADGRGSDTRQPTDLVQLATAVARFAGCDAAVKRHRLVVRADGEPWAAVDVARIRQVLVNLVKNAADALGEERQGQIQIRVDEVGSRAVVEVMDDGPGVPEDLVDRIFEPFFSTKGEQGLGLGLDISRKIARAHGGDLDLESEAGKGACFRLSLPALPD